jgi:5-methylcytosine-specific restriction endonuclease McrA
MARPQLQARFFVTPAGVAIPKARTLLVSQRREIFDRDGRMCQYCLCPVSWLRPRSWPYSGNSPANVDHRIPRSRGGQNDPDNLVLSCERCNKSKGAV